MPIDANIPLMAGRYPDQPSMLDQFSKVMALKNLIQQTQQNSQTFQQVSQENQLKLDQMQQAADDELAVRKIFNDTGGDLEKAAPQVLQQIGPAGLPILDTVIKHKQSLETLNKEQLANAQTVAKSYSDTIDQIAALPPEQRNAAYQAKVQALPIPPDQKAKLPPQWDDSLMAKYGDVIKQQTNDIALQKQKADAKEAGLKATTAERTLPDAVTGLTPEQTAKLGSSQEVADAKYRQLQQKKAAGQPLSADEKTWVTAYEKQKTLVSESTAKIRMEGLGATREYQVYDNKVDPKTGKAYGTTFVNSNELNRAKVEEPGRYTIAAFTPAAVIEKKTGEAFGPGGKGSEEILAFNTAIQHAELLKKASDALANGDTKALNSINNTLKTQFGSPEATNFQTIANAYSREVTKALAAGHITDNEIKEQGATIPANASPAQINGALDAYKGLMQSKVNLRKQQFEAGKKGETTFQQQGEDQSGASNPPFPKASPQASAPQFSVTAPNGKTYHFKSQADADQFKTKAGIK